MKYKYLILALLCTLVLTVSLQLIGFSKNLQLLIGCPFGLLFGVIASELDIRRARK